MTKKKATALTEKIDSGRPPKGLAMEWLSGPWGSATKQDVVKDAIQGEGILKRINQILDVKFQTSTEPDYSTDASERERAFSAGYRKALKDVHRLLQLDT